MAKLVLNCHVNTHYQSIVKLVENGSLQFSAGHFLTFPRCPIKGLDSGDKPGQGLWEFPGMGEPSYRWKKMTLSTPPATLNDMFPFIFNGRLSTSGNMSDSDRWRQNWKISTLCKWDVFSRTTTNRKEDVSDVHGLLQKLQFYNFAKFIAEFEIFTVVLGLASAVWRGRFLPAHLSFIRCISLLATSGCLSFLNLFLSDSSRESLKRGGKRLQFLMKHLPSC